MQGAPCPRPTIVAAVELLEEKERGSNLLQPPKTKRCRGMQSSGPCEDAGCIAVSAQKVAV